MFHYSTELAAAGATARASWAIFWVTLLSAVAAIGVVAVALLGPSRERSKAARDENRRVAERTSQSKRACADTKALVEQMLWDLKGSPLVPVDTFWLWHNWLEVRARLLRKFFDLSSEPELLILLSSHMQATYEVRDLLVPLREKVYHRTETSTQLDATRRGLEQSLSRLSS